MVLKGGSCLSQKPKPSKSFESPKSIAASSQPCIKRSRPACPCPLLSSRLQLMGPVTHIASEDTPRRKRLDLYASLRSLQSLSQLLVEDNSLVVSVKANKHQMKQTGKKLCDLKAQVELWVRTLGEWKACIQLAPNQDTMDVANKTGTIEIELHWLNLLWRLFSTLKLFSKN